MIRRSFVALATLVALGVACAPAAAPAQPAAPSSAPTGFAPDRSAPAAPEAAIKKGGIIVGAQQAAMSTFHPWKGDVTIERSFSGVYDQLVQNDHRENFDFRRDNDIKPGLAERWENPDPTTYVFHLRKNAKWHDGKPFTADDVVFSLMSWTDAKEAPEPSQSAGSLIKSVDKVDDHTVRVNLKRSSVNFLAMLAFNRNVFIAPKHVEDLSKTIVGTGPFKVVQAQLDRVVVLERNPDFYLPGKPHPDGAKIFQGMERGAQQAGFLAKGLDYINVGDQAQFDALKKLVPADVKTTSYLQNHGVSLYMKQDKPPFDDIRVRRAMHLAIDRDGLVKAVTFGAGAINPPGGLALHSFSLQLDELKTLPGWRQPKDQDIAEAKRLLAEAGYANGIKTSMQTAQDRTTARPVMEAVGPMLKAIGIDAEIMALERGVFLQNQREGKYEIMVDLIHSDPPTQRLNGFYRTGGSLNKAPIADPELDKMIDDQDSAPDLKTSGEINKKLQRYILDKVYTVSTIELPSFAFWQPWFINYPISFSAQPYIASWEDIWIDPDKGYPKDRTLER